MGYRKEYDDVEKLPIENHDADDIGHGRRPSFVDGDGAIPGESFEYGNSLYAKLQRLAGKFNIEQRGIERVPENERNDTSLLNIGTMVSKLKNAVVASA
jgi:hypothetical protein